MHLGIVCYLWHIDKKHDSIAKVHNISLSLYFKVSQIQNCALFTIHLGCCQMIALDVTNLNETHCEVTALTPDRKCVGNVIIQRSHTETVMDRTTNADD